jgi:hypothetical protein
MGFIMDESKSVRRRRPISVAAIHTLEARQLLATPSGARPDNLTWFDKGERQALIARMTNVPNQSTLAGKIGSGTTAQKRAFDNALLDYMRTRSNVDYYYDPSDATSNAAFIKNSISYSKPITASDLIVDQRKFPSDNTSDATATLSGDIDYRSPNGVNGTDFALTINRFEHWGDLANATWLGSSKAKYVDEVRYELAQWSTQFQALDVPSDWDDIGKSGWDLSSSIRADAWTQAYFKLLSPDNSSWDGADNTLMLYKLMQHGDFLYKTAQSEKVDESADSNKTMTLASALFALGKMFPELDTAAAWEQEGRELLVKAMAAQVYEDGSHREQAVGYTLGVIEDMLNSYQLDVINGDAGSWSSETLDTVTKMVESYRQFLTPDGRRPGTGDTLRVLSVGLFLKAGMILDTINPTTTTVTDPVDTNDGSFDVADATSFGVGDVLIGQGRSEMMRVTGKNGSTINVDRGIGNTGVQSLNDNHLLYNLGDQPFAKPTIGDVWLLGQIATTPFLNVPATPEGVLGNRGKAYAMPDSGNYIMRSDDSSSATQITFDAGPKGGPHGHLDPLNFELWSGDRPLIVDPGPYKYGNSSDRNYVISTKAHNTINVDGQNVGWIEGEKQPALIASHNFQSGYATVTGTQFGYSTLAGQPVITRSIWYNYGGTMVIVDWGESATSHQFQQSFNVPGTVAANVAGGSGGTEFKTRFGDGGDNVRVKMINGGSLTKGGLTFVTDNTESDLKADAYRYTVSKTGDFAVFVTLINTYTGLTVPNVDAQMITTNPQPGQSVQVKLITNGSEQTLSFEQPDMVRPSSTLQLNAQVNDTAVDSKGNLHLAFNDRNDGHLKYTVRDATTHKWSVAQVIDDADGNVAAQIDLQIDKDGRPAIAYYDQPAGDLKFAQLSTQNNAWRVRTVDSKGTVGMNPSLTFSRGGSPIISYYNRTKGDLKVAMAQSTIDWSITTIDSGGDVGRYSQIMLDPNRTDLNSRYVVAYEDQTNAQFKYAYTSGTLRFETIKSSGMTQSGGFLSLAFEDTGSGTIGTPTSDRMQPRFSFYEQWPDASLWLATRSKTTGWSTARIDGTGTTKKVGAYNQLSYATGKAEIFYYDDRNNQLRHTIYNPSNKTWAYYIVVTAGGRETRPQRVGSAWLTTSWDSKSSTLTLESA